MEIVWGHIGICGGYHGIISSPMEWGYTKQFNNLVMRSCVSKLCRIYCADLGHLGSGVSQIILIEKG